MDQIDTEKYLNDLRVETKNSSTLKLLRELTRWDDVAHNEEMEIIAREVITRISLRKASILIFIICFIMSNIGSAFSEHFYVFDEDEKEIRRQLKVDIGTHLTILILISCSIFLFHFSISLTIISLYLLWTVKMTFDWYTPINNKLKSICT